MRTVVIVLTITLALLSACQTGSDAGSGQNADGYTDISVEELNQMLAEGDPLLVNVHIPYDGEIPETDLFIPFDQIADNLDQLPGKDEPIVLYCRSGSMSTTAAKELASLGYTQIFELDGGMRAWTAAGNELLTETP